MISDGGQLAVFFSWLVRSSVQTCLLICLILAVQLTLRSKLAPRWRYGLWLLVVIRLALPWAPQSGISVYNLVPLAASDSAISTARAVSDDVALPGWPAAAASARSPPVDRSPSEPAGAEAGREDAHADRIAGLTDLQTRFHDADDLDVATARETLGPEPLTRFLPLVWLLGAIAVAGCALAESFALAATIRRQRFVTDQATLDLLENCKEEMGVHSYLAVVETPRVSSPALLGFIRPRLLLPPGTVASLGRDRLRYVFLHELTHLKRHDIAVNWVMTVLQALHWFNPLVWYAFGRMRADRELACDALVLSHGRSEESKAYGLTIVYLLEKFSRRRSVPCLAGVLEDHTLIKRRIEMIARFKRASGLWTALGVVLVIALGCVTLTNAQPASETSDINAIRKDRPWIPETTTLDAEGRLKDKTDFPFVADPRVLGTWKVVDFVRDKKQFVPGEQWWGGGLDHLKGMRFGKDGTLAVKVKDEDWRKYGARWTKGKVLDDDTASEYEITRAGGNSYLFFQWKSGDYTIRYSKPAYYVLQKEPGSGEERSDDGQPKSIDAIRKDRPWIPETTTLDADGRLKDKTDFPFVADPRVLGTWKVVDFVRDKKQFVPGEQWWGGDLDHLKGMRFDKDGTLATKVKDDDWRKRGGRWTKGKVLGDDDACEYEITRAGGNSYLFFQWKSGDYNIRYKKPAYYVLQKEPGSGEETSDDGQQKSIDAIRKGRPWIPETTTLDAKGHLKDKTDYPFVADPDVLGTWRVVDFVGEKAQFVPGKQRWRGKLDHLKGMRFDEDGTVALKLKDEDWRKYGARWTKGKFLQDAACEYEITRAGGDSYLFFQWKSGDYTIRYSKPAYYVLQKGPG